MILPSDIVLVKTATGTKENTYQYMIVESYIDKKTFVLIDAFEYGCNSWNVTQPLQENNQNIVKKLSKKRYKNLLLIWKIEKAFYNLIGLSHPLPDLIFIAQVATAFKKIGVGEYLLLSLKFLFKRKKQSPISRLEYIFQNARIIEKKQEKSRKKAEKKQGEKQVKIMNSKKSTVTPEKRINDNLELATLLQSEPDFNKWKSENRYVPESIVKKINNRLPKELQRSRTLYTQLKNDLNKVNSFWYRLFA